ncbi:hypothetical protein [Tortoise microvirus 95]|nr:hypothetical protein [Tortoise microvirus 3]QCS37379.1 hypothetical protein [Tortoise microvirus 95]QCS37397.1 hypothetical protein [Tortoise microvirus 98]QCS37441.1 hypothetical protein [Tortoise microvirus 3]QCS37494.1 hypothetical protein [Tortoise microvirus 109]
MESFMFNIDLQNGSIIDSINTPLAAVQLLIPCAMTRCIDKLTERANISLADFIRLACAEYILSFKD